MSICWLLFLPIIHAIVVLQPVPKRNVHFERQNSLSHVNKKKTHKTSVFSWVYLMPEMSEAAVSPAAYIDRYQEVEGEVMDSNPAEAFFMAVLGPLLYEWWFKNKMRVFENICVCVCAGQVIFLFCFLFCMKHEGVPLCYCSLVCPFSSLFFFL